MSYNIFYKVFWKKVFEFNVNRDKIRVSFENIEWFIREVLKWEIYVLFFFDVLVSSLGIGFESLDLNFDFFVYKACDFT